MGIADSLKFTSAQAPGNFVSWILRAKTRMIHSIFPSAENNQMPNIELWLKMIGIPLFIFSMVLYGLGKLQTVGIISGLGGILIIGVTLFVSKVKKNVKVQMLT